LRRRGARVPPPPAGLQAVSLRGARPGAASQAQSAYWNPAVRRATAARVPRALPAALPPAHAACIRRRFPSPCAPSPQEQADDGTAPKGHEFKHARRQMAQMMTVLRERQIADGIDRRTARKLEKAVSVGAGMGGR
jgi:hypothetical protein